MNKFYLHHSNDFKKGKGAVNNSTKNFNQANEFIRAIKKQDQGDPVIRREKPPGNQQISAAQKKALANAHGGG